MPVLYKCVVSAPSRIVLMTVEILGIEDKLEMKDVNPLKGENVTPEFLKINHLHTIPVLVDDDLILTDSHVIATYLAAKYKTPKSEQLYPTDIKLKHKVDQMLYFQSTLMTPKIIGVMNTLKKSEVAPTNEQVSALKETYGFLDKYLENSPFLVSTTLTLADVACVSSLASLNLYVGFDEFVNLSKWFKSLEKEEWFQKINARGVKMFAEYLKQFKLKRG